MAVIQRSKRLHRVSPTILAFRSLQSYNGEDFRGAMERCLNLYNNDREGFRALQYRDMTQDFSWDKPAGRYMELFHHMCNQ